MKLLESPLIKTLLIIVCLVIILGCIWRVGAFISHSIDPINEYGHARQDEINSTVNKISTPEEIIALSTRTDEEWKTMLSPSEYDILRSAGTERAFTSNLLHEDRAGTYVTADCGEPVFRSEQKFDSGTGWPSFYAPINPEAIIEHEDTTLGVTRIEIVSAGCKSHLGHVFNDAPQTPTGLRYCINGIALRFIPDEIQ